MQGNQPRWDACPAIAANHAARKWLSIEVNRMLSRNTIESYSRSLEDFLRFSEREGIAPELGSREHVAAYVRDLMTRKNTQNPKLIHIDSGAGLSNATIQLRLTVLRLFYDHLVVEGLRPNNPVGRSYLSKRRGAEVRQGPLFRRHRKLPWIPSEEQWEAILKTIKREPLRNRFMFALSYDAALRRQDLLNVETNDIDPAHRLLRVRADKTKNGLERVVPYSEATGQLYAAYLQHRRQLSQDRGVLFLSESNRNSCEPLSIWTWSKVAKDIATSAGVHSFTTHSLRHLCLTDLARAGWDIHEIAAFAGHRSLACTLLYIHLSGRELASKLAEGMSQIHAWRIQQLAEVRS
jgi:integrase/recombinase XerD